ncbi:histidine kinase [Aurantimonas sp. C2-3-R2]|uniref:histidine kinase n=1 Tax=unclassified Aurantimonas TaxID=2638230 RepID=UPI003FA4A8B2
MRQTTMPTLVRLLTTLLILAGIIYGIMAALVYFVQPTRHEMTVEVPLPQLDPGAPTESLRR